MAGEERKGSGVEEPVPRHNQQESSGEHQESIAGAPLNDPVDHVYIPPVAFTESCLFAITVPFWRATMETCQVPPVPRSPFPSYRPSPLPDRSTLVFIAAIPIAAMAAMKNVTFTC